MYKYVIKKRKGKYVKGILRVENINQAKVFDTKEEAEEVCALLNESIEDHKINGYTIISIYVGECIEVKIGNKYF